jgi:hypothetical protein
MGLGAIQWHGIRSFTSEKENVDTSRAANHIVAKLKHVVFKNETAKATLSASLRGHTTAANVSASFSRAASLL